MPQYLPIKELDPVSNALNFETADCNVLGGCDLYTTKATGSDKKLYKSIDKTLEEQHESLIRFSASLSPPEAVSAAAALNLNRDSPFGRLSQTSAKRTFAYLVATMNASHTDYDFSSSRPDDFRHEKSLKAVMDALDTTLYNLRPKRCTSYQTGPPHWSSSVTPAGPPTPTPGQKWSPKMWHAIDSQMQLKSCSIYSYAPKDDPFDAEEGALWSFNFLFFNKSRKRVCYVYLRGLSFMNPANVGLSPSPGCLASGTWTISRTTAQTRGQSTGSASVRRRRSIDVAGTKTTRIMSFEKLTRLSRDCCQKAKRVNSSVRLLRRDLRRVDAVAAGAHAIGVKAPSGVAAWSPGARVRSAA